MADIKLHSGFKYTLTASYVKTNPDGSTLPGVVEGSPVWSASVPEVVILVPTADGLSCDVIWNGVAQDLVISVLADGDLGAGVFPISMSIVMDLEAPLGATAGSIGISAELPMEA